MILVVLGLLLALVSPLLLLPIEKLLPFPHIIEEVVKLLIVGMIIKRERQTKESFGAWVFMAGLIFATSESILYLANIFALGNSILFSQRLALTSSLHISTMMLMYFLGRKNYVGLAAGFVGAVVIHYLFNMRCLTSFP